MTTQQSRIISKVLSPAVRLWLRSQLEQVEDLNVKIEGRSSQILTGYVPSVSVAARKAVYQGLHLSQIQLGGENIRINLGGVLKGQPLRLLEPVPVSGSLLLEEADLKASLHSPLLSTALTELFATLVPKHILTNSGIDLKNCKITWEKVAIDSNSLTLGGTLATATGNQTPFVLSAGLQLASSHQLRLAPLQIQLLPSLSQSNLEAFEVDLGSEVDIEELTLISGQIVCRGSLRVIP